MLGPLSIEGIEGLLRGYTSYLFMCSVGLIASTLTFAGLSYGFQHHFSKAQFDIDSKLILLGFQLVAILVGTCFSYELNRKFTWKDVVGAASGEPSKDLANELPCAEVSEQKH